jgi:acetolactate synthase-1/3 small subunit
VFSIQNPALFGSGSLNTGHWILNTLSHGNPRLTPPRRAPRLRALSMRHTISVLVENKFGVLTRIAGMFSGRGFNIDSLNVGPTLDPSTSRMTIVVTGDDTVLEQVTKQLHKLIDVIEIDDFRDNEVVERELVLMRVTVDSANRAEVMQLCDIFRAKVVDVQHNVLGIEVTGNESKIDKFLMLMGKFGITELSRTGRVALARRPH